jgi:hypothetical protein
VPAHDHRRVEHSRLTPAQRSARARAGAHAQHARHGAATQKAFFASPASLTYWLEQVDPIGELDVVERARRATSARRAYFTTLAFRSSRARQARREGST